MSKNLVIVESPAKAKTLESFLGEDYKVVSSYGHIADLPSKDIGIDLETFTPRYIVSDEKKQIVKQIKDLVKKSEIIWLASDEDREGEAIAWHLSNQLKLDKSKTKRIVFNSITKKAVIKAINAPREIDYNLVNAQQARRILDRIVGYELSPVLWKKVRRGLSAGRVQSVATRLIIEREREIENFQTKYSFKVSAIFLTSEAKEIKATLGKNLDKKKIVEDFLQKNIGAEYKVSNLETKPTKRNPAAPFTTSTLQQEASIKLGFPVGRTMSVAQKLYESGRITYMRTDSNNLSSEAMQRAKEVVEKLYGNRYSKKQKYRNKNKGAQEAHEAIRPTDMTLGKINVDYDQNRLYELIWKRTIASQMSSAELSLTTVEIQGNQFSEKYYAKGEVIVFDGFLKVYTESSDEESAKERKNLLPNIEIGDVLNYKTILATQRFSKPPARYTEASLVQQLEKLGIGRPSTYAPTISTIQNRGYVEQGKDLGHERAYLQIQLIKDQMTVSNLSEMAGASKGKLLPTHIGRIVNDFLVENFENILDYNFTAKVEKSFDDIALGNEDWKEMMVLFYKGFHPKVKHVEETAKRQSGERVLGKDPLTNKTVAVRLGKYGPLAQIGAHGDEDIRYASLLPEQSIDKINLKEALELFQLPRILGQYKEIEIQANSGRYGPYIKYEDKYISIPKTENIFTITLDHAVILIQEKEKANLPIAVYQSFNVTKGKGRFGPFIKWNDLFINVSKRYDYDNLSTKDIEELIQSKLKKEAEKVVKSWEEEGIRVEKARWKKFNLIKGKKKVELPKETDIEGITLEDAKKMLETKQKKKK